MPVSLARVHVAASGALGSTMKDVDYDPDDESAYECFECGNIVLARDNPVTCADCGGDMRHRRVPLE